MVVDGLINVAKVFNFVIFLNFPFPELSYLMDLVLQEVCVQTQKRFVHI